MNNTSTLFTTAPQDFVGKVGFGTISAEHTTCTTTDTDKSGTSDTVIDTGEQDPNNVPMGKSPEQMFLEHCKTFMTTDRTAHATITINGHVEHHPLKSQTLLHYCKKFLRDQTGDIPTKQEVARLLDILGTEAFFKPERVSLHLRIARVNDAIYFNLANANHEVVKITAEGWQVISSEAALEDGVRFIRNDRMLPLPSPVNGGSLELLQGHVKLTNDTDFILITSWLIGACQPNGPYPILILQGEHGSGKSSLTRKLVDLIDPSNIPLCTYPRSERDLAIAAAKAHLLCYDNLSGLSPQLADALCRLATGGGVATRKLYTDDEERIFTYTRPAIINGISELLNRHDLTDRAVVITTTSISKQDRLPESVMRERWQQDRPLIIGALFTAVSIALANANKVHLDGYPRMADFCHWVCCAEPALPWPAGKFLEAYEANRLEIVEEGLESDPVSEAVQALLAGKEKWEGTPNNLLQNLSATAPEHIKRLKDWPKQPNLMSGKLRRSATFLREKGLDVAWIKSGNRRIIISRIFSQPDLPKPTSKSLPTREEQGYGREPESQLPIRRASVKAPTEEQEMECGVL